MRHAGADLPFEASPGNLVAVISVRVGAPSGDDAILLARAAAARIHATTVAERSDVGAVILCAFPDARGAEAAALDALTATLEAASAGRSKPIAGIGRALPGSDGLADSYRQAHRALSVAGVNGTVPPILSFSAALPYLALRADPYLLSQISDAVRPLLRASGEDLIPTLQAYFDAGGALSAAAENLGIHRHTLTARLARIESLTGRSLARRSDVLLLQLGLLAHHVGPPSALEEHGGSAD